MAESCDALRLDLLTGAPIDFGGSGSVLQQLSPDPVRASRAAWKRNVELEQLDGDHLLSFLGVLREESRFEVPSRWYLNRVISPAVNTSRNPISAWKSDVFLALEAN